MRISRRTFQLAVAGIACAQIVALDAVLAASVPTSQSFEAFTNNHPVADIAHWGGATDDAGAVSTNAAAVAALTTYTSGGGDLPLPSASHEKLLAVSGTVSNSVSSTTGGVVIAEWLVMPTQRVQEPEGSDENQMAFYLSTNSELVVWHRNPAVPTNQWLTLSGNPTLSTSAWARITVLQDYVTDRYQISVNGDAYTNALGETRGGDPNGSWFHMVQTNGYLSTFETDGNQLTYVDDVRFASRSIAYSGTLFSEGAGNDGSIVTTNTITLTGDSFADPLTPSHYTTSGVPAGLTVALSRVGDTTATITFSGSATAPHTDDVVAGFEFLDDAFTLGAAASVDGVTNALTLDFHDGVGVTWATNLLSEASANDGSVDDDITVTLAGDTFVDTTYNLGDEYEVTSGIVPTGLVLSVSYVDPLHVTVSLGSAADAHDGGSEGFTLAFKDAAFTGGSASSLPGYSAGLTVSFVAQPAVSYSSGSFVERDANNGGIDQAVTITLTGDTWAADLDATTHVAVSGVPGGLTFDLLRMNPTNLTASFTGTATDHDGDPDGSVTLTFSNSAFVAIGDASLVNDAAKTFTIDFTPQRSLSYSTGTFSESLANNGTVDTVMTVTLNPNGSGETFAGSVDDDFVDAGWVTDSNVPNGLTAVATRASDTTVSITLTGAASPHDVDVSNMAFAFTGDAFTKADLAQIGNTSTNGLVVDFNSTALALNLVPYRESFETYADGALMGADKGWQPGDAGTVTSETAIVSALNAAFSEFPMVTTHTKVLKITDEITDEIRSETGGELFTDCMLYVTPREAAPAGSTDYQVAFYVNTNQQMVLWHQGTSSNEWTTLTGTTVTTGAWHRITVQQDHANHRFQLYLDRSETPISDAAGYARRTGSSTPGSWFRMVNQSGCLSQLEIIGADESVPCYLDDLVVDTERPGFIPIPGSLFMFR